MNIFCTSSDPVIAAQNLDDKRLVKAVLETAQLLSTALYNLGYWTSNLYKPTHANHPCTLWAGRSRGNFNWLVLHGLALNEEYKYRYMRGGHRSTTVILNCAEAFKECKLDRLGMEPFVNCTNISGNVNIVKLYQTYMIQSKWNPETKWTRRGPPSWYKPIKVAA